MIKRVSLTHEGLSRLRSGFKSGSDFCLRTDSPRDTVKCSRSQISFVSPSIHRIIESDPTVSEFSLMTPDSSRCCEILRSLLNGSPVSVCGDLVGILHSISLELGNDELASCVEPDLTLDNVLDSIDMKRRLLVSTEREIEFIASHFYELQDQISSLDSSTIDNILGSKSLVVESEHSILNFIDRLIAEHGGDSEYRSLLRHLHLEYLDVDDIDAFIQKIDEFNICEFLPCIYRRLLYPVERNSISEEDRERFLKIMVPFKGNNFEGIFSRMSREINGNPVTKKIIEIRESTNRQDCRSNASFLVDPEKRDKSDWWYGTNNVKGCHFIIDFKDKRVSLNGYSLKAHSASWDNILLKSWRVEGSNDYETWKIVDEQKNSDPVLSNLAEGHWPCEESEWFRYFRIIMTENNSTSNYYMAFHAIEFFGQICNAQ